MLSPAGKARCHEKVASFGSANGSNFAETMTVLRNATLSALEPDAALQRVWDKVPFMSTDETAVEGKHAKINAELSQSKARHYSEA